MSTAGPRRTVYTFWVTRETDPGTGALSPKVRVWLARPTRLEIGRGAVWTGPAFDADLYAEWTLEQCLWHAKTYPDDDRQCVRVEGDLVKGPLDEVERLS